MLSVLVASGMLTEKQIVDVCSTSIPLIVGDTVILKSKGNTRCKMLLVALDETRSKAIVRPLEQDEEAMATNTEVDSERLFAIGSVICSANQVKAAKLHAAQYFPGARIKPVITRAGGIDPDRAHYVADFLRRKDVVEVVESSIAKSKSSIRWRLKRRRHPLWLSLVEEMKARGLKPVSWGYFWAITSSGQYELLTADNCCCGTCRDLGFLNYEDLRDLIKTLGRHLEAVSDGTLKLDVDGLLRRVKSEEEFRRGSFMTHLENSSPVGAHCLTLLLSTAVDRRFKKECKHGFPDGRVVSEPRTMEQLLGRKTKPTDWNSKCEVCADVAGKTELKGNVYCCTHCNLTVHKECIERSQWDLPSTKDGLWTCWYCVRDIDECQHESSCDQCNERGYLFDDVSRAINLLQTLEEDKKPPPTEVDARGTKKAKASTSALPAPKESASAGRDVSASAVLRARLELIAEKELRYVAHLIRDRNQDCFKDLALTTLTLDSCYILMDYWAKISCTKRDTACCEGNQIGMSAHGMVFIYPNPTLAQRATIDAKYGPQPWDKFGPAPDEGGLRFLEEHFSVFCDDAKQGAFHTASEVEAAMRVFRVGRPWMNTLRRVMCQSDYASNYREPTTEVDWPSLGTRCFSEAGMGKDDVDRNTANHKAGFRRKKDEGYNFECANDVMAAARSLQLKGQNYGILRLDRDRETVMKGRVPVPHISNFAIWSVSPEAITFWESLDYQASLGSIAKTGRAVGYGPGHSISLKDFDALHRTKDKQDTGATLLMADYDAHVRQRASREEKVASAAEAANKKAEIERQKEARAAAAATKASELNTDGIDTCPRCAKRFLTDGWYLRHSASACCNDRQEDLKKLKRERSVCEILKLRDSSSIAEYRGKLSQLRDLRVCLQGPGIVGLGIKRDGSSIVVEFVDKRGLAFLSGMIDAGYVLLEINGLPVSPIEHPQIPSQIAASAILRLHFKRPPPPLPYHGMARKGIRKSRKYTMHPEQTAWLENFVFRDGVQLQRDKDAAGSMKKHFHSRLRGDTLTPMWLEQDAIASWLCARVRDEKDRRKAAKKEKKAQSKSSASATSSSAKKGNGKRKATASRAGLSDGSSEETNCGSDSGDSGDDEESDE